MATQETTIEEERRPDWPRHHGIRVRRESHEGPLHGRPATTSFRRSGAPSCALEARPPASVSDVGSAARIVITSLPSAASLLEVANELAGAPARADDRDRNQHAADRGEGGGAGACSAAARTTLLDCPISGTGAQARTDDVVVYASGPRSACRAVGPVLSGFARAHYYVGPFGAGSKTKFVANLLVAIHNVAAAEGLVLAMKAGLDPARDLEGDCRRGRQFPDAAGARSDDGAGALHGSQRHAVDLQEGPDDHWRLRPPARMPDAPPGRGRPYLYGGGRGGARRRTTRPRSARCLK